LKSRERPQGKKKKGEELHPGGDGECEVSDGKVEKEGTRELKRRKKIGTEISTNKEAREQNEQAAKKKES